MWGSMKTLLILFVIFNTALAIDHTGRLGADDGKGGDPSLVVEHDASSNTDSAPAPAPVPQTEGASRDRPSPPGDPAPQSFFIYSHVLEVGLHRGSATHIGGGTFISCNHLRRSNPRNEIKVDGKQYGGMVYSLDDVDLCMFVLKNVPDLPKTQAVCRPIQSGERLYIYGQVSGLVGGTADLSKHFDGGIVEVSTPGTGIVPGDSGGGVFDTQGNLVAVAVADVNEYDAVHIRPLVLEKNRFPKHPSILQAPMESLITGIGTETLLFSASWCGPCRTVKQAILPKIEEAGYKVTLVDTDKYLDLSVEYDILSIPTWVILKDGKEVHRESYGKVETLLEHLK